MGQKRHRGAGGALGLALVVAVAAQLALVVLAPRWIERRAVAVFEREEALLARHAADRIEAGLTEVRRRLHDFHRRPLPVGDPAALAPAMRECIEQVSRPWDEEAGVVWFVHDTAGRVLAVDPRFPAGMRERFAGHLHADGQGSAHRHGEVSVCSKCLEHLQAVSMSVSLGGGMFLTANVDLKRLARPTLEALFEPGQGGAWLLDGDRVLFAVGTAADRPEPGGASVVGLAALRGLGAGWSVEVAVPRATVAPSVHAAASALTAGSSLVLLLIVGVAVMATRRERRLRERVESHARSLEQKERELEALVRRHRGLFDRSLDLVLVIDLEGRILDANATALERFGYALDELRGEPITVLHPPEVHDEARAVFAELLEHGAARRELRCVDRRGDELVCDVAASLVELSGETVVQSISRDVTERRRTERELEASREELAHAQKMDAVGRLAGGVAHDFNNLLVVMMNYSTLLARTLDDPQAVADALEIRTAVERAAALTRQLLAFSRKELVQPEPVDVVAVVRGLHKMLGRLIGEHIALDIEADTSEAVVLFDRGRLEQVVINLVVNARDAMPGGGRITLGVRRDSGKVVLSVDDDGAGMDDETVARMFEPFFTTKAAGRGTGLGLSTVHGIVSQAGGGIAVRSEEGAGTTIEIALGEHHAAPSEPSLIPPARRAWGDGETVLVVEDEPAVRRAVQRILTDSGYRVLVSADGVEALELWRRRAADVALVLSDVLMPRMGGTALAREIARVDPDLPVVLMTGYSEEHVGLARRDGRTILQKPVDPSLLLQAIRDALDAPPAERRSA